MKEENEILPEHLWNEKRLKGLAGIYHCGVRQTIAGTAIGIPDARDPI
jgi:hypothetical protein